MFLGVDKILTLVESKNLVENLCERELNNPEGVGLDLRLGEVFKISGESFLGITERETPKVFSIAKFDERKTSQIAIRPQDFYLVKTVEKVNLPENLVGILKPRTTLQRSGLFLRTSQIAPGYCGELTFGLANVGPCNVTIELGARIVHIMFSEIKGKAHPYRGQWQKGRVTTEKKEVQV
ncbi:dCTP deaminase [candidate division WWE3 bacterium CG06_land_8_20_14_3_00_42_16]|uniref:dCTP deaminase n=4 Tax=Katanobacteria TaxID=422282 RepID=A0A2M7API0_UNCKA|nr:MAG: dCTP deaminase [bacterium CG1_02_42_9]PIU69301.1 MAG: dCTP deaminase [candidate division WWE3 bacterium CG06_land_8_20_14_3_00_42_16]PIZ42258.1 MAG: dCTP deaminase [candidate division WWE3 bacterium CG_4_10_14_0_2_um_filter_42_8]PJC69274.1 MAG: dCTP deaminase [candidate division WWE3 bacterium CG_4_8_14_3_um_filter_42_11]